MKRMDKHMLLCYLNPFTLDGMASRWVLGVD